MQARAQEQSGGMRTPPRSPTSSTAYSEEKIAKWLEADYEWLGTAKPGFKREIAGEHDFNLAVKGVTAMLNSRDCRGLFLAGDVGVGKTHLMRILARRIRWRTGREWFDCGDSDGQLWRLDSEQNERIEELYGKHVFLDDFGVETRSEYGRRVDFTGRFVRFFHGRRGPNARLFVTTNLDSASLNVLYDGRILDRIMDLCVVVKFSGASKRAKDVFQ